MKGEQTKFSTAILHIEVARALSVVATLARVRFHRAPTQEKGAAYPIAVH